MRTGEGDDATDRCARRADDDARPTRRGETTDVARRHHLDPPDVV
jgi:hypothetical protein